MVLSMESMQLKLKEVYTTILNHQHRHKIGDDKMELMYQSAASQYIDRAATAIAIIHTVHAVTSLTVKSFSFYLILSLTLINRVS